jgi:ribosomal protein S18 acetylase RimI-like enzyme
METRALEADDRPWAERVVSGHNASPRVVSRGVLHDTRTLPGLIAESDGVPIGVLHYRVVGEQFEVVVLAAVRRCEGVGGRLLRAAELLARSQGCKRCWLVTTNDNAGAIEFYRAMDWRQVAVHRGAVRESRRLKPEIPEFAADGTAIEDEIEFELLLEGG